MISFTSLFLGLVLGAQTIQLAVADGVERVDLHLDGQIIGTLDSEPWTLEYDFGQELAPHEMLAIAFDNDNEEVGRAQQWINLPRQPAEAELILGATDSGDSRTAHLTWESLAGANPTSIRIYFDGQALDVPDPREFELPPHHPGQIHFLRAELEFAESITSVVEAIFGGTYADRVSTELTAVPVRLDKGVADPAPEDLEGLFLSGDRSLRVAAIETGVADIVMVRDPSTQASIDEQRRPAGYNPTFARSGAASTGATKRAQDWRLQFLWPVPRRHASVQGLYDLFPPSTVLTSQHGDLLQLMTHARLWPDPRDKQRLADAVAVAGITATGGRSRRAVVLYLGDQRQDDSNLTAAQVRRFLERLQVPLYVWTTTRPKDLESTWGKASKVVSYAQIEGAWRRLKKDLERQRVVWVSGIHLPQEIELAPEAEGFSLAR
ncbi:MAG: hypothetical protein EP299_09225 [Acidobacteria bacterium]|nr:MAG: hypothetical protein EP299_09225 [Acidobacteriota bacterium]